MKFPFLFVFFPFLVLIIVSCDLFKDNSSGTKQWTQQLVSSSDESGEGVTVDSSDNIYVTGWTLGGLDGNTNSGWGDLFLVKYNSSGVKQ